MGNVTSPEITRILNDWNAGKAGAKEELLPFVYEELKRQARVYMASERRDHTLQPTALVHEAFLRLSSRSEVEWKNRQHFFAISARVMRRILVDHARAKAATRRGNRPIRFSLEDVNIAMEDKAFSIVALDEVLSELANCDPRQASIVELRFFGGFDNREVALALDVSVRTVIREWQSARLWLFRALNRSTR